jgi:hypothetical protein
MEVRLPPDREAHLTALAAESGLSTEEVLEEALVLWEAHQARRGRSRAKHTPAQAAARIRELRKGNSLPDGETIEDLINYGRA